jgi:hypothetical protein
MTDGEVLFVLQGYLDWPTKLNALAERAAAIGHLAEANAKAEARMNERLVASSASSVTIAPSRVPAGNYSNRPNRPATFYHYLEMELRKALGLPTDLTSS